MRVSFQKESLLPPRPAAAGASGAAAQEPGAAPVGEPWQILPRRR